MAQALCEWTCGQCGTRQAMTHEANAMLRASSATFYCVFGHARHYPLGKTETEKLRDKLDEERLLRQRAEQKIAEKADEVRVAWNTASEQREEADHQRRRANGYKGHAARITKRAKAGVCPCCNRHFTALERHMASKHPEFTPDAPEPLRVVQGGKA